MPATTTIRIPRAVTKNADPACAARELHAALSVERSSLVITFAATGSALDGLGKALGDCFPGVPVIGCTTAGEITPSGYEEGSVVAISLPAEHFIAAVGTIDGLAECEMAAADGLVGSLLDRLRRQGGEPGPKNTFAFLLIDGLSMREESVVLALSTALGEIRLFGGSAGDALNFQRTAVLYDGAFRSDRAVLALVQTELPFTAFKTQHFLPCGEKMVVTGADTLRRVVTEINGESAAGEYARLLGLAPTDLNPSIFATNPVVVRFGGDIFVRSIQKVNRDGSLTFYCAIDEGLVLTLARGVDLVDNLAATFVQVRAEIGRPLLVLGCDCILRRLEIERTGIREEVERILRANQVIGFNTYGEQWNAMHVNQTLTGVAIGNGGPGAA
jgi:hypothetical protein